MAASFGNNKLILNYHDAVIYGSDLALLDSPTAWLNDACIHFQMTRLQQQQSSNSTLFFDPSVISFLMHQCTDEEDIHDFKEGYNNFVNIKKMFVPINNDHATSHQRPGGGTHWSLLVVVLLEVRQDQRMYWHFDSIRGNNFNAARAVANKFENVFGNSTAAEEVLECQTPQQENGYDCGIHVLAAAEALCLVKSQDVVSHEAALQEWVSKRESFAIESRKSIASDIRKLAAEYSNSRAET